MLQAGSFTVRLMLQSALETADGCGGFQLSWNDEFEVWARLVPISGIVKVRADNSQTELTHWIYLRKRSGISSGMRFVKGSRNFYIDTIVDPDETGRYFLCNVNEKEIASL